MYGPVILLLCARPGDDIMGAGAAILRAREQGCVVSSYMLSNGLLPAPRWQFWKKNPRADAIETLVATTRRLAVEFGHQFIGWNEIDGAGKLAWHMPQLAKNIQRAFLSLKPDVVWAPAFLGIDPDYDAINVIASRLPQLAQHPVDVYEYMPRPITRPGAGAGKSTMVFPNRYGMELPVNRTQSESTKCHHALDSLTKIYDEPLPNDCDRELFRLLPQHEYHRPPYGYRNPAMLRGNPAGDETAKAAIPRLLNWLRTPLTRAAALAAQHADGNRPETPLHHLPQG